MTTDTQPTANTLSLTSLAAALAFGVSTLSQEQQVEVVAQFTAMLSTICHKCARDLEPDDALKFISQTGEFIQAIALRPPMIKPPLLSLVPISPTKH